MKKSEITTLKKGKIVEHKIFSMLLESNYDVYVPLCDDNGVDCIVETSNGRLLKIQIKSKSADDKMPYTFAEIKHKETENYYFIFYAQKTEDIWCIPSKVFLKLANKDKNNKYTLNLKTQENKEDAEKYKVKDKVQFSGTELADVAAI